MLEIIDLEVHYGSIKAVRGVDLNVRPGEISALIGSNGAGKSSVLNAVCGAVPSTGGRVRFGNAELTGKTPEYVARQGISLVPEGRRVFGTLTVLENLRMGFRGRAKRFAAELDRVRGTFPMLGQYLASPAALLSGGQQQQVAIARALLTEPRMLLLDEPSLGLDPLVTDAIFEAVGRLRDSGLGILLVEQNVHRALQIADRIYVLKDGVLVHEGTDAAQAWTMLSGSFQKRPPATSDARADAVTPAVASTSEEAS